MDVNGIDVSEFQGEIDWERVKASGCQFAMLRAGYGTDTTDGQFHRNASECNRIGLPIGAYWFCYAFSPADAVREADKCLDVISCYRLDYPVCYDIEQASAACAAAENIAMSATLTTALIHSFCGHIEGHGYLPMFYTNQYFLKAYLNGQSPKRYPFWYACYNDALDGTQCAMWQYTNEGHVDGVNGSVCLNRSLLEKTSSRTLSSSASLSSAVSMSLLSEAEYITYVIQPGDTLNSIALRYGTTVPQLALLNNISDSRKIYSGRTLKVPENWAT